MSDKPRTDDRHNPLPRPAAIIEARAEMDRPDDGKVDDFTRRLRASGYASGDAVVAGMCNSAAERIEELERENARLKRTLEDEGIQLSDAHDEINKVRAKVARLKEATMEAKHIAEALGLFRLPVDVAATRMPWAPDWPLDRLMVRAAELLDPSRPRLT